MDAAATSPESLFASPHHDVYPAISATHALAGTAHGRSVLVTGAGRGIGRATALAFAQAGARKVVLAARSAGELDEVERAVRALGVKDVVKVVTDVTSIESVRQLFAKAGEVNVIINNAGKCEGFAPIDQSDPDDWWSTYEVNVKGVYLMVREALKRSIANAGLDAPLDLTIVNVSSSGAVYAFPGMSAYPTAKTAVNRFTQFIDLEYGARGVCAFAIHPGAIPTQLSLDIVPQQMRHLLADTVELAAGLALWLAVKGEEVGFLRGRYVSSNWDVAELLAKKDEIEAKGLLLTKTPGA